MQVGNGLLAGSRMQHLFQNFNLFCKQKIFLIPEGEYTKLGSLELAHLSSTYSSPFGCPDLELAKVKFSRGKKIIHPIIDHNFARKRALDAYANG
jgi:hypothetical protein